MAEEKEKDYFSKNHIKLLITTRLKYEKEFTSGRKSKSVLWGKVLSEIKEEALDFNFSRTQIHRKFLNIMITYKRIKNRNKRTGRDATAWEHFDTLDKVYGTKHSIDPPVENLVSTLNLLAVNSLEIHQDKDAEINSPETGPTVRNKRRRNKESETLDFLEQEAKKENDRHMEMMELERQKLATERERIQEMRDLKVILQQMLVDRSSE